MAAQAVSQLRMALRSLRQSPAFAVALLVNVTLGIATLSAVFAVLHSVLLQPLPYPEPDRIMLVRHEMPGIPLQGEPTLFGGFQGQVAHYSQRSRLIDSIGAYTFYDAAIEHAGGPEYVRTGAVTAGFFGALGLPPLHGRLFEEGASQDREMVLSRRWWQTRDGADAAAVGASRRVDGLDTVVRGVVGAQGPFPQQAPALWMLRSGREVSATPQLLVDGFVVRTEPGVTPAQLAIELDALLAELPDEIDDAFVRRAVDEGRLRARVERLDDHLSGSLTQSLWLLLAAAALVVIGAVANASGLQLLRRESQRGETAVRRALGARTTNLARDAALETGLVIAAGAALGVDIAATAVGWLRTAGPRDLPRIGELNVGPETVALAAAVAAGMLVWLTLIRVAATARAESDWRHAGRGADSASRGRLRNSVAAVQLAIALVLLIGSGLVVRSFVALSAVDPGFEPDSVLTFRVPFPAGEIQAAGGLGVATPFYDQLSERLAAHPGITFAGYAACAPFEQGCGPQGLSFRAADAPSSDAESQLQAVVQAGPGYFDALGISLVAGRTLVRSDHENTTNAAVVSAATADAMWPGRNPIGQQFVTADIAHFTPMTVVGVVGDARHSRLDSAVEPTVYLPVVLAEQTYELAAVSFVVRTDRPPLALANDVREILAGVRADIPAAGMQSLDDAVRASTAQIRFVIAVLAGSALAVLVLGATGVYSVVAYAVSQRRAEFGIRIALGAAARDLRVLVVRQAGAIAVIGIGAGLLAASLGARLLEATLFGVTSTDAVTYGSAAAVLGLTAFIASVIPARRAARTDPALTLRGD